MKISYNWLQTYFKKPLPSAEKLAEAFGEHLSEIEEMEVRDDDTVIDIKTLADRNCYTLSHRGVAYEVAAILNLTKEDPEVQSFEIKDTKHLNINIQNKELCSRYIGRRIENVTVTESPLWLKKRLEVLGHRSINSIVDATNFIMLDVGQPLHAFDADKVKGDIQIRNAEEGEKIITLDGKEITLTTDILVIADSEGLLAIAGIKGGKRAEVDAHTKNIILEAAHFDAVNIRKSSGKVGIKNESSKRFENNISSTLAELGMKKVTALVASYNTDSSIGETVDIYSKKEEQTSIEIQVSFITDVLGITISTEEIISILKRLEIVVSEKGEGENGMLVLTIPFERRDLIIPEDIVEEVGRIYGYEKIEPLSLLQAPAQIIDKKFYYTEYIKDLLVEKGFSEVFTYSLASEGDLEIEKSVAEDKNFIRSSLVKGMSKALELNMYNAPLLGLTSINIFEIGSVFPSQGEYTSLCIAVARTKQYKPLSKEDTSNEAVRQIREHLLETLGAHVNIVCTIDDTGGLLLIKNKQIGKINEIDGIMELNLDALIETLPDPTSNMVIKPYVFSQTRYTSISSYPFMLRDIAVFVPGEKSEEGTCLKAEEIIKEEGGELLMRMDLFDVFTKTFKDTGEIKTSYAYRLVYQSHEKTLTDEEINKIMEKMTSRMNEQQGWMVR